MPTTLPFLRNKSHIRQEELKFNIFHIMGALSRGKMSTGWNVRVGNAVGKGQEREVSLNSPLAVDKIPGGAGLV